jgi:hypothetical protein
MLRQQTADRVKNLGKQLDCGRSEIRLSEMRHCEAVADCVLKKA